MQQIFRIYKNSCSSSTKNEMPRSLARELYSMPYSSSFVTLIHVCVSVCEHAVCRNERKKFLYYE